MDNDDRKIILLFGNDTSCNPQDEQGRTPFHDLAMTQGTSAEADAEFASAAEQMINIFLNSGAGIKFGILDKDQEGHTALDLALKVNPDSVKSVKKVFIKYSLSADPKLTKPSSLASDLSAYWDTCKLASEQLNSQASTSNSSAVFFKAAAPANTSTYKKEDQAQQINQPRFKQ